MSIHTMSTRTLIWTLCWVGCTAGVASSIRVAAQDYQDVGGHGDKGDHDATFQVCRVGWKFGEGPIATLKTLKSNYTSAFDKATGAICEAGESDCCVSGKRRGAFCTSLSTDNANCGACGHSCDAGQTCNAGVCGAATRDGSSGRLSPLEGETCYEFKTHASTERVDDAPFQVAAGESYEQFYFRAPWPNGSVATGFATLTDNSQVLNHWLLFSTDEDQVDGFHLTAPLPTLIGTNPHTIAVWGAGGSNLVPPCDVGFALPAQGAMLNLQWSYANSTGQAQPDGSSVQICVTLGSQRAHVASVTWLGTEDLGGNEWFGGAGMPAHQVSTFSTSCTPCRAGLGSSDAIHIVGFQPHMQKLGTRMQTEVQHVSGMSELLFDQPFKFGDERHYFKSYDLRPGETLTTRCTFNNTTDNGVPYGTSTEDEMCYQFVFAYPAGALANGAASLLGSSDTCW